MTKNIYSRNGVSENPRFSWQHEWSAIKMQDKELDWSEWWCPSLSDNSHVNILVKSNMKITEVGADEAARQVEESCNQVTFQNFCTILWLHKLKKQCASLWKIYLPRIIRNK